MRAHARARVRATVCARDRCIHILRLLLESVIHESKMYEVNYICKKYVNDEIIRNQSMGRPESIAIKTRIRVYAEKIS